MLSSRSRRAGRDIALYEYMGACFCLYLIRYHTRVICMHTLACLLGDIIWHVQVMAGAGHGMYELNECIVSGMIQVTAQSCRVRKNRS